MRFCSIEDCGREYLARGYCVTHYRRMQDGRDMHTPVRKYLESKLCELNLKEVF